MTQDDLDRLIHRYFEGGLSPAEERRLWHLLRTEPAAADRFVELSELESALVESLRADEAAPPEVSLPGRSARRQTRVLPTAPSTRRTIWPLFLAAGLMLGFVALLVRSASTPEPVEIVRRPVPPPEKPRVEPVVTKPEAAPRPQPAPPPPVVEKRTPPVPEPAPVIVRKPVEPTPDPAPEVKPEPVPAPKLVAPAPTKIVEATIVKVEGEVVDDAGAAAKADQPLASGQGLEVRGAKGSAVVALPDGTRVELGPDTKLEKFVLSAEQKRFVLARGAATSTVAKQPARMSVVFQTPHAEVTVLGTKLTVEIGRESTRVEVQEGRVRCRRSSDGSSADVAAGRFAVAGKGPAPVSRPVPVVRSFQDGPEYQGTRDTWISIDEPTTNFATGSLLRLRKLSGPLTTLIRWDVSSIPPGSRVVSAEMSFWVTGKLVGDVKIYDLRRPFEESEATWRTARGGLSWGTQGAQSDGDRGARPVALLAPQKPGFTTVAMNDLGVALLQDWVNAPASNFGILVAGPEQGNEWNLDSRESTVADRRPKLTITYLPAAK